MARNWTLPLSADGNNSSLFVDDTTNYLLTGGYPINAPAVVFTDTADRHVAVNVAPNGSYPTDPSALTDGTIASVPSPADPNGAGTSTTGAAASLDTDSSLKPSLSIDATNPAHVTFTVSGLEPDYSGTVTFTDTSGTQDVVPIESNGAYAANLSNLTNGTITYLLSVSDPAGNVITVDPTLNLGDGAANAPAGTPQLPNLLNVNSPSTQTFGETLVTRPPWNVAGVDYAVGVPAGTTLNDPVVGGVLAAALVAQGCSLSGDVINLNGSNQTISGWDFANGGYVLNINGSNDTVENNNFAFSSSADASASGGSLIGTGTSAVNTTIIDNTLQGNGYGTIGIGLIDSDSPGTTTIEYNSIANAYAEDLVIGTPASSGVNIIIQDNLIENAGMGFSAGAHGDWIQLGAYNGDTSYVFDSVNINYNTWVQDVPYTSDPTQGITYAPETEVKTADYSNNTVIVAPGAYMGPAFVGYDLTWQLASTIDNNYAVFHTYPDNEAGITLNWDGGGPYSGTETELGNINLQTGTSYETTSPSPPPSGSNPVANGNFATDSFSGWTLGGNYTSTTYGPEIFIDTDAEGGSTYAAGMGSVGSDGTLSQTITTTAGQTYTLSFWLQNEASGTNDFKAIWNGQTLLSLSNAAQSGYTEYTYTVTATGSTTTLEFSAANGPSQWDLDNISLTANATSTAPPPAAPVISTGVVNPSTDPTVTLTGTALDGSTVTVSDGGATTLGTATASSTGAWSFTTADLSAGSYAFTATDTTSAGTSAASSAFDVTVPDPPTAAPVISTGVANSNASVTLTGTAPDGSTVTVSDGGTTTLGTATASSSGAWSFTTADLSAGSYAFTATDTTSAGTSAASSAFDVTVTSSSPPPSGSNLVANGNFATDSFSGWTLGGNYTSTYFGPEIFIDTDAEGSSTYAAGMGSVGSDGTLSQTIATTAGQTYTLSFWLQNEASGTNDFKAIWNGQTPLSLSNAAQSGYTEYTYTVTATGSTTTLEFSAANGPSQWDLDNVSLTANSTPPPDPTVIQTDTSSFGSTSLTEVGNNYFLDNSSGSGPELKYGGADVVASQFGGWVPIGAVQTASGYDVAWEIPGANEFGVWTTDSSGNFISHTPVLSGTSTTLESFAPIFGQDLNGGGVTGVPTVIQTDGSTSLTGVWYNYFLDNSSGSGPELKYGGADVVASQFGGWVPIGAVQTTSGYDVAWEIPGANEFGVWTTDSSGNFISHTPALSGTSTTLESYESIFQQDLNGDGVIGLYAAPGTTLQVSAPLADPSGSATIGAGATLELAVADSGSVTFASSTGTLILESPSTFSGEIFNFTGNGSLSGSDQIDLTNINFNSVKDSYANGVLTVTDGTNTDKLDFNGSYKLANFDFASDGSGGTIVYDPPAPTSNALAPTSSGQTVTASEPPTGGSATIGTGATLELSAACSEAVTFSGSTGTLVLGSSSTSGGQSSNFTGTVSGFGAQDVIDLPSIAFDAQTTLGYLPNSNQTGGTLSLTDGAQSAKIALLGNYMASSFAVASDNHGGTMVTEASQASNQSLLTNPQHT